MDFQHPIIKDLSWLINNPGLLKPDNVLIPDHHWFNQQLQTIHDALLKLDNDPERLGRFESNIKPFVGDYFEKLIALWLEQNPNIHHIKQHLVAFEAKRSIGEFDFLFIDKSNRTSFHWEVAVKYYLQHFNGEKYSFLGPNAKDTLTKKTTKMLNQQLLLSQNPHAAKLLIDYPKPIKAVGILKGILFYPASSNWQKPADLPPELAENHLKGWWTDSHSLHIPQASPTSRWFILRKPYWLGLHYGKTEPSNIPYTISNLKIYLASHFKQSNQSLLLAEVMQKNNKDQKDKDKWLEVSRGFIVSTHWPATI